MGWHRAALGEYVDRGEIGVQTGPFGTQLRASDYTEEGVPVINVRNIGYGSLLLDKLEHVPDSVVRRLGQHILEPNDIVFGRKGAVDRHILVGESQAGWMQGSDCIRIRINTPALSPEFVSYAFCLQSHIKWMQNQCSNKATMASLNQDVICRIVISIPDSHTQQRIVEVLSAYDNLIANNRRRIQLLEQAAQLLYREWFVRLRFPGHEHAKIKDGIPEGWERKTLAELCESIDYGYTASATQEEVGPKFLRITDIVPDCIDWSAVPYCKIDERRMGQFRLREGDVVIARTGATVGYAKRLHKRHPDAVFASYLVRLRFKPEVDNIMVGVFVESEAYKNYIRSRVGGAAQPNANAQVLSGAKIFVPPQRILHDFREFVEPMVDQLEVLLHQNQILQSARDLLLPRLMSGEVAV